MGRLRTRLRRRCGPSDRGAEPLETVIIVPAVILFIGLALAAGMVAMTRQAVQHAAHEAARSASLARTAAEAHQIGQSAAQQSLANAPGFDCMTSHVAVDTAGFAIPVGLPATVSARVDCTITFAGLGFDRIMGERHISGESTSPLDRYRERA